MSNAKVNFTTVEAHGQGQLKLPIELQFVRVYVRVFLNPLATERTEKAGEIKRSKVRDAKGVLRCGVA